MPELFACVPSFLQSSEHPYEGGPLLFQLDRRKRKPCKLPRQPHAQPTHLTTTAYGIEMQCKSVHEHLIPVLSDGHPDLRTQGPALKELPGPSTDLHKRNPRGRCCQRPGPWTGRPGGWGSDQLSSNRGTDQRSQALLPTAQHSSFRRTRTAEGTPWGHCIPFLLSYPRDTQLLLSCGKLLRGIATWPP